LRGRRTWLGLAALLLAGCSPDPSPGILRVGTSGDYRSFSFVDGFGQRAGLDVVLVERFARETGRTLEFVPFVWRELSEDFSKHRFDLRRELRPGLGRIGQKLSRWLVRWSGAPSVSDLEGRVQDELRSFALSEETLEEISTALAELGRG
jgi:hypothetical protein